MRTWRKVMAGLAVALFIAAVFAAPYLAAYQAAHQATVAAINAAEAKQNSAQTKQALAHLTDTDKGVQSLLQYVASVQKSRNNGMWFAAELQSICAEVHCQPVPK